MQSSPLFGRGLDVKKKKHTCLPITIVNKEFDVILSCVACRQIVHPQAKSTSQHVLYRSRVEARSADSAQSAQAGGKVDTFTVYECLNK